MKMPAFSATVLGLVIVAMGAGCTSSDVVSPSEQWVLTMADEFDGGGGVGGGTLPSAALWEIETGYGSEDIPEGWGNNEWQLYTNSVENVRVEGGNLVITARCPVGPCRSRDGSITSARIRTKGLYEQAQGRVEGRIKLPEGQGLWPAFWMLGGNIDEVPWPGCGEIDIMENFGRELDTVEGSLHGPGYCGSTQLCATTNISSAFQLPEGEAFTDDFHIFAIEWDPGRISYSVDGEVYQIIRSGDVSWRGDWVFNNEFFVLLNVAVGGNPVPDPSSTPFESEMLIDYVRFFERAQ